MIILKSHSSYYNIHQVYVPGHCSKVFQTQRITKHTPARLITPNWNPYNYSLYIQQTPHTQTSYYPNLTNPTTKRKTQTYKQYNQQTINTEHQLNIEQNTQIKPTHIYRPKFNLSFQYYCSNQKTESSILIQNTQRNILLFFTKIN